MKLSFVIPAYNEENYLGDCLESIFREMKGRDDDIEVIVINNASTDKTGEVALSFPGVKLVNEAKKGLANARERGYAESSGELIANVDADSRLTPGWIDRAFHEFEDRNLVALSGPNIYYDISTLANIGVRIFYAIGMPIYFINHYVFKIGGMLQGGNFVVRRSAWEKIGGYSEGVDFYGEDADIAKRMQKAGKIRFTFGFPMYSSGRRFREEGFFRMGIRYAANYLWVIFFEKPFTRAYKDIRRKLNSKA